MQDLPPCNRRRFLADLGLTGLAGLAGLSGLSGLDFWLQADAFAEAEPEPGPEARGAAAPAATRRGVLRLQLQAIRLNEMEAFYARTLGFATRRDGDALIVQTGGTELRFDPAPSGAPYYHVAWAIPENKFAQGKAWLAKRTPLLKTPDGQDEFYFRQVNRTACYFADPAGNVLELIARHELGDRGEGAFNLQDWLYVNHVGLVVDDMAAAMAEIRQNLGLELVREPAPNFAQLGDSHRHVVLVTRQRLWIPERRQAAEVYPLTAVLHGSPARSFHSERYSYRIELEG